METQKEDSELAPAAVFLRGAALVVFCRKSF